MIDFIAQIGAASETLKKAIDLTRKAEFVELRDVLLDLRQQLQDIRDANLELREQNRELRERLDKREALTFKRNLWWRTTPDGKDDGPYCPKCFGGDQKVVRMTDVNSPEGANRCPVCNYYERHSERW
jgi:hypothetical protein